MRTRGLEAPVVLKPDAKPGDEPADALDGTPKVRQQNHKQKSSTKKKEVPVSPREQRVWPLPDGSFVFTQAFGCVPQLGNLYLPGAGCPPDRPVVHTGIDLAAPEGTVFYAAASGWVTLAGYDRPTPDANTRIIIQHDGRQEGYSTEYLHWVASYVAVGDYVRAGEPIGEVGNVGYSTGPHLHFSVIDLASGEHIDPVRWLPPNNNAGAFKGRRPTAEMRLPAGTTVGQPEEADQNPAPIPTKVKVPKSPPQVEGGGADGRRHRHHDAAGGGQASSPASKHEKNKRAKNGDATASETSAGDETKKRERHKDGKHSGRSASGEDDQHKHKDKSADSGDPTADIGRGGRRNEDASDPDQGSGHHRGGSDRGNSRGDGNHGGGKNNRGHHNSKHGSSNDGNDRGSNDHGGNGKEKNGSTRKKHDVTADAELDQSTQSADSESQASSDDTGKEAEAPTESAKRGDT